MSTTPKWSVREYQRIASASYHDDKLIVLFEDGSQVSIDTESILPPQMRGADWASLTSNPYEILVPSAGEPVEIAWSTIRALSDPDYNRHLAAMAQEQAGLIGARIRELRESRSLSRAELADRSGLSPESLSQIEEGRQGVGLATLERLVTTLNYSLSELAVAPGEPASP